MKKQNNHLTKAIILLLLAAVFLGLTGCSTQKLDQMPGGSSVAGPQPEGNSGNSDFDISDESGNNPNFDKYEENTTPAPSDTPAPVEPEDAVVDTSKEKTCYLTISCAAILNNMDMLKDGKEVLVPTNGVILARTKVTFYEGESVFDLLKRETRNRRIHMESTFMPVFNSAYIRGIGNLYEFDCGAESGWSYCVNKWFPSYGVSRYVIKEGDEIEFHYTCDLGRDVGNQMSN